VIGATKTALLDPSKPERRASVWASLLHQPEPPRRVAESDQLLRQQLHTHRRTVILRKFLGEERWQPVASEEVAQGGSGPGMNQELIVMGVKHAALPETAFCRREKATQAALRL
jgi:hypothetical protein